MKNFIRYLSLLLSIFLLAGCVLPPRQVPICSADGLRLLQSQVDGISGQFIELGDQVLVTMPTYYLFLGNSKNLTPANAVLLNKVAERLNCYPTESIGVITYNSTLGCAASNLALARQRSKLVADVLRIYGVSRLVYEKAVSLSGPAASCRENRIEIVTMKVT